MTSDVSCTSKADHTTLNPTTHQYGARGENLQIYQAGVETHLANLSTRERDAWPRPLMPNGAP
jgi:hypothetical protein